MIKITHSTRTAPNFTLKEFLHWPNVLNLPKRKVYIRIIEQNFTPEIFANICKISYFLQNIRDAVNDKFPEMHGLIQITITSGFRPIQYEHLKHRSGLSQHCLGHAVDFVVDRGGQPVMEWIFNEYLKDWHGGKAIAYRPDQTIRFIHIDLGNKRTWTYGNI